MYINIAGYKFIATPLLELETIRHQLKMKAIALEIKGTILLGTEGINLFVAGSAAAIDAYKAFLATMAWYTDLTFKESESQTIPFSRLIVRIKNEIISMGQAQVRPSIKTAPYITPETLKQWYDEKRDFVILDTRNDYEVAVGTFDQALDLNIENFRQFPDAVKILPESLKNKPVVTFCTGGIRCEKAAELMQQQGYSEVYQLEGGILGYFEKIGGQHYHGECFVFDKRLTLDSALQPTETERCFSHQKIETAADLQAVVGFSHCQHLRRSRKVA